ncbi:SEC-C metal-binding domain-containing protein [Paraglaciecola sp. L3A3]|uniref:SEC-C metal-binding domain-containing protein n=1 Tax=Paraglaciecola sp. L3A3 TaxID=2686358 RepID=UPI00131DC395|nr:SEC-C metal-binding domain-containing protein [Paraglaciecola sp. L3A3]
MNELSNTPSSEKSEGSCCSKSNCFAPQTPVRRKLAKVGRNDLCPCNSGLKFKKCCGINV